MEIVHVASELAPIAKVGGLADVTFGLSNALTKKGHQVKVILPKYECLDTGQLTDLHVLEASFPVNENNKTIDNTLWTARLGDIECLLIEDHHPDRYFARGAIYQEVDDTERFLYFCKVASTFIEKNLPEVVHLHDWPTAACALILKEKVKTVFTIHNLAHQGRCHFSNLDRLAIPYDLALLQDPLELEALNLLRGAIHTASVLTAVSPTYAQEILTPEMGLHLEDDLLQRKKHLTGVLNGIDYQYWNPQTDPHLTKTYSYENVREGKAENRKKVLKLFGLEEGKPVVAAITRLVAQKGPDLIAYGIEKTIELGGQFILLGNGADEALHDQFKALDKLPGVAISFEYDEPLSHLLYAAADLLLMPSIFEPCGLTQMIAMHYGTIPLVRATGGLRDTVEDGRNGFTFDIPDNRGVSSVLEKGFEAYHHLEQWDQLIKNGMEEDWSFSNSAEKYLQLYE